MPPELPEKGFAIGFGPPGTASQLVSGGGEGSPPLSDGPGMCSEIWAFHLGSRNRPRGAQSEYSGAFGSQNVSKMESKMEILGILEKLIFACMRNVLAMFQAPQIDEKSMFF